MVDVDEDRAVRRPAADIDPVVDHREEVTVDERAPLVGDQRRAERHEAPLVPFDHLGERADHVQLGDPFVLQCRGRGAAETQPADDDAQPVVRRIGGTEPTDRLLGRREHARHEERLAELHLHTSICSTGSSRRRSISSPIRVDRTSSTSNARLTRRTAPEVSRPAP
ncbi:MAG: hypothetical protein R2697_04175 [Ilumatobacteraceae bacterium]